MYDVQSQGCQDGREKEINAMPVTSYSCCYSPVERKQSENKKTKWIRKQSEISHVAHHVFIWIHIILFFIILC